MSAAKTSSDEQSVMALGSVVTIMFGVAAVFWPGITMLVLLYIFSAYVLVAGVSSVVKGIDSMGKNQAGLLHMLLGFFELAVGVYFLRHTSVSFTTFVLLIGLVLVIEGVVGLIVTAADKMLDAKSQLLSYLVSLVAIVAGIMVMFAQPVHGVSFVWILGVYALIAGTVRVFHLAKVN